MYPDDSVESYIQNRIYRKLFDKHRKYQASKLTATYMRKYLVKTTMLNWFEINRVIKLMKSPLNLDIYQIFNRIRPRRPYMMGKDKIIDVNSPDYNNFREQHEKRRTP